MWKFRNHPQNILIVGDEGALLYSVSAANAIFAATHDPEARRRLQKRLEENHRAGLTVVVNSSAQEFRVESFPPMNFMDRRKLIQRRLHMAFPQAYATASRSLDSDHALLAGVQPVGAFLSWCNNLHAEKTSFASLPIEGASLITALLPPASKGWVMLLANFRTGGLRQIVLCDGRLVFTRQTPALMDTAALHRVINDTRGYLARFGLREGTVLQTLCVLGKVPIQSVSDTTLLQNMTYFSPWQVGEKLGFTNIVDEDEEFADLIFAKWIAQQKKLYLPLTKRILPEVQNEKIHNQWSRIGKRVAWLVMFVAIGNMGWNLQNLVAQILANNHEAESIAAMRQHLSLEQANLAPAAQPLGRLRAALERQRIFSEPQPQPWDIIDRFGHEVQGRVQVTHAQWSDDGALHVDLVLKVAQSADHETITESFKNMISQVTQGMPNYSIEITRYPFPALPQDVLTNLTDKDEGQNDRPSASLVMRRRS